MASWSRTSTLSSPWLERPASVRLLEPRKPVMGLFGIGAEAEVELGVEGVAEEELHDHLARP